MADIGDNSFINENDKFVKYKYVLEEFFVLINGETMEIPKERIYTINIEHDFENSMFPIFEVGVALEGSRYYKIVKNKSDVRFKVRIQTYYTEKDGGEKSLMRDFINDTFIMFLEDSADDADEDLKKKYDIPNEDELDKSDNMMEFFLFKESIITGLRQSINYVFSSADLTTVIVALLQIAKGKNILMSPLENTEVYKDLILPPQPIDKQLRYLNNNYGFHKEGTLIYFGLYHGYILNYKAGCTAWTDGEWKETVIYVFEKSSELSGLSNVILKYNEERYYFTVQADKIEIDAHSISNSLVSGGGSTLSVLDTRMQTAETFNSGATTQEGETSSIIFNNTSNKYMGSTYAAQKRSSNIVITLTLVNTNIEGLNPNKEFSIIFENTAHNDKYKGKYRIASAKHNISLGNNDTESEIVFKKVG